MERIPILQMGDALLVTIQVDMHDQLALTLQEDLTESIVRRRARGVLIDISALEIVDSFIGRMLDSIAAMSRLLDAQTVVVGMRPAVAMKRSFTGGSRSSDGRSAASTRMPSSRLASARASNTACSCASS